VGEKVLLLNTFSGKLKSRWFVPFVITQVFPNINVTLKGDYGKEFKVNYRESSTTEEVLTFFTKHLHHHE